MIKRRTTYTPTAAERRTIEKGRHSPSMTVADFFAGVERLAAKKARAKGRSTVRLKKKRATAHMDKAKIDKRLAEGLDDIEKGRAYDPFNSAAAVMRFLNQQKRERRS